MKRERGNLRLFILLSYCKPTISTAPTKAKSREPAYSQALFQNKINRQRVRSRESDRHTDGQIPMVGGVWSGDGEGGREKTMNRDRIC